MRCREIIANVCCTFVASTIACAASQSSGDPIDAFLAQLKKPEPDTRIAALRELETSLDPRIPDAMFPLLSDEGNSIRRLAARAIGSRWWQISNEMPEFVEALRRNKKSEFEDERNMIARAIGLLKRDYTSEMFACSTNKRWAIYERRGLPCLIDTKTDTEELLGWPREESLGLELFMPAMGNDTLSKSVSWHPAKEAVAFSILQSRRATTVWVWQHQFGLCKLARSELIKLLHPKGVIDEPNPITAEVKEWKGDELHVSVGLGTVRRGTGRCGSLGSFQAQLASNIRGGSSEPLAQVS